MTRELTVIDLIHALQKLPSDTRLGHYDYMDDGNEPPIDDIPDLYIRQFGDVTYVYTSYESTGVDL